MTTFPAVLVPGNKICLLFWVFAAFCQAVNSDGPSPGVRPRVAYENEIMTINCTVNMINVVSVDYGHEFEEMEYTCLSSRAYATVYQRCQNKTSCEIPVNSDTFNDRPCDDSISVYLSVRYVCVSPFPASSFTRRYTPVAIVSHTSTFSPFSEGVQTCSPCVGCVRCFRCRRRNITWPETPAGEWATARCPNNPNLFEARLLCGTNPVDWVGRPDLSKCVSSKIDDIQTQLKATKDIQSLDTFTSNLVTYAETESSLSGGDLIGLSQSMYQAVKKFDVYAANETRDIRLHKHHLSWAAMKMTDNLLDDGRSMSWVDVPKTSWGSLATKMMSTVEASAFQMVESLTAGETQVNITKNILLEASVFESDSSSPVKDIIFPNAEALKGSSWENTHNSFRLPADALARNRRVKVLFTSYNNLENLLLPNSSRAFCSDLDDSDDSEACDAIINTRIVSASIDSYRMRGSETMLQHPVVFTLEHKRTENVSNPVCAFWKLGDGDDEGGYWSEEGCELVTSNLTHTTCTCNHLTSFAVIMSPTSPEVTGANAIALDVLTYIGCSISIICLFLSFLTFACFRSLQCDRITIHKNLVLCLFIANMIFLIGIDLASLEIFCSVIAGFLHYFFLTVFAWMCIEGVQLYYMLVEVFEADKSHVLWFYLSAYGVPAVIVIISASVYHQGYGTDRYCWLTTEKGFIWAFIGPAAAIILVNCVMLGIALRAMYRHSVSAATWRMKEKSRIQQIRSWVKGSVVLIILLGLTWAFGFAFVSESTIAFAYIFTILNSLQGLFIFIFHCLLNDKVQIEYKRCVKKADWLPERFRNWYTGPRGSSFASSPNQTHSSTGGRPWSRLLSRQRRNSQSTSVSRITSQKRSSLKKQEDPRPDVVVAPDSGIEDPSSYLEPAQIHLGESEFDTLGLSSALEGSIVDTNYSEKFAKRPEIVPLTEEQQEIAPNRNLVSDESDTRHTERHGKTARNVDGLSSASVTSDRGQNFKSNSVQFDESLDISQSERPKRTKRKSSKKPTADENFGSSQKSPDSKEFSVDFESLENSGDQLNEPERNPHEHSSSTKPSSGSVKNYRMPKSTGV